MKHAERQIARRTGMTAHEKMALMGTGLAHSKNWQRPSHDKRRRCPLCKHKFEDAGHRPCRRLIK